MNRKKWALALLAVICVALTLLNASWLAPTPGGELAVIAHRGTIQPEDPAPDGCPARHVRMLAHGYIENTLLSMQGAVAYGARGFALDVQTSADGQAMIFRDPTLECRTDGTGRVSQRPLAYLKGLDVGFGYTSDGGRAFPLRGRGVGAMPTAAEVIRAFPQAILIFKLTAPADADAIVAAFREAGTAIGDRHGFAGTPEALTRLRTLTRAGWVIDPAASEACLSAYRRTGWTSLAPDSCRGATLILPRDGGWTLWGWPYRFLDRMAGAGTRAIVTKNAAGEPLAGLDEPEQLGEVPRDYRGMLLIEDMYVTGRALER